MSRLELEREAVRGEEVARLLACDAVRQAVEEQLNARREAILALRSDQTAEFARIRSGLEAMEALMASLESIAALGGLARERLAGGRAEETARRVL
ncbi:hypothetical protein NNJEOMEG_03867 [Fundidesulfovibrio magnetotacticus]|uniref:Uncharacterized protein n=1 Tax=Fundidesulfovibrio magnetotacticus TaxID=2730080 RepID=A0A6V8LUA9_9BACT|nr:hypothetical protein [Fundidesulfovibrio magnetotacticus]GFK95993.1 hypothetical protein NNJEOMEG_03867 [Fundidesulfovibrio magnetotacticus]